MADKEQVIKEQLEHNGIWSFSEFYSYAHSWFKNEGYGVMEDKYNEKVSGDSRDIAIEWIISKGISDYFKVEIKIRFDITGLKDVEAEIDGKKKKTNKGRIWLEIKGYLVKDPGSKWDVTAGWRFMRDFYNKYIIPARVDDMQNKVRSDVREFKDSLKAYLELLGKR